MDLAQHTDQPTYVEVAGQRFGFSEISLELSGRLQQWIKDHVPHPLKVVRDHLDGFSSQDRVALLEQARRDSAMWPPAIGSAESVRILGASPAGQIETLYVGLLMHQPDATRHDAEWLWKKIRRDEEKSRVIYGLIFGSEEDDEDGDPKG